MKISYPAIPGYNIEAAVKLETSINFRGSKGYSERAWQHAQDSVRGKPDPTDEAIKRQIGRIVKREER